MAIPPPPGPPPPLGPPPIGGLKLGGSGKSNCPDPRSALLQSIQQGKSLKKTTTVDKSGPVLAGKISSSSSPSSGIVTSSPKTFNHVPNTINGGPKLSGLFEGLTSMPKLKPVNGRGPQTAFSKRNAAAAQETQKTTVTTNTQNNNNSVTASKTQTTSNEPMDFNTELTKHLTLKKQKQQINATEANLRTNRGPPPQPPTQLKNQSSTTSSSEVEKSIIITKSPVAGKASSPTLSEGSSSTSSTNSVKKNIANLSLSLGKNPNNINSTSSSTAGIPTPSSASSLSTSSIHMQVAPNKSSLFGGNINSNSNNNNNSNNNTSFSNSKSNSSSSMKPVVNHGKPNCAPKPPGIQQLIANGSKPTVSRHHSMKSPRSPPIASPGGPVYPVTQQFGTLRNPSHLFQSHESISTSIRQAPNPPIGRPTVAPPKPPTIKPPPPATPARSVSNTNLSNLPFSTALSSSSTSNVSSLKDQLRSTQISHTGSASNVSNLSPLNTLSTTTTTNSTLCSDSSDKLNTSSSSLINNHINNSRIGGGTTTMDKSNNNNINGANAPPLPPHRTCPAPPPPMRQTSTNNQNINVAPPVPPQRHSSIRMNSITTTVSQQGTIPHAITNMSNNSGSSGGVGRIVVDLEMKYGNRFHNVTEFSSPPPFLNIPKTYPSRNNIKTANEIRKPRAPEPPANKPRINFIQINDQKLYSSESSYC